jgi:glycosyltransferase involved in cell wall biosynthesis
MTEEEIKKKLKELKACVVVPTYNNDQTLEAVFLDLKAYSGAIIVVNDGSTDSTASIINSIEDIVVCSYPKNRGKGFALQTGFRKAVELGFDYAVSMDSDGQHYPADIANLLEKSAENPDAIVVGSRDLQHENMPGKNTFANRFSNFWFRLETGQKLEDTQSGFRLYPLKSVVNRKYFTCRYDFELEVLVRSVWRGTPALSVPVRVFYPPEKERVSHFKPVRDFTRISILNTFLVLIAFLWVKPFRFVRQINKKTVNDFVKKHIFAADNSNAVIAFSVMLGIFWGIVPVWGYQMLIAYGLAHVLKLNKAIALVASNISIPPMIPLILYGSYITGAWILGNPLELDLNTISLETAKQNIIQYIIGSLVLAVACAIVFGIIGYVLLIVFRRKKKSFR